MADSVEVAEDFKASLQFLDSNDRYAINNFTVIAKESVQYADAISNVLVEHIAKAPPNHKLPALYVLDSIVKNIGTPYTLFLGHRLYSTFMDAYSLVDAPVRRKLDEMLKTWKAPVPGSSDRRPVFPPEITSRIENVLQQVRAKSQQHDQRQQQSQQELLRGRQPPRMPTPVRQGYIDTSEQAYQPPPANPPPHVPPQPHATPQPHVNAQPHIPPQHSVPPPQSIPPPYAMPPLPILPSIPMHQHLPANPPPPAIHVPEIPSTDFLAALLAQTGYTYNSTPPPPPPPPLVPPPQQLPFIASQPPRPMSTGLTEEAPSLKSDLKRPRRNLIATLYDDRPNRCLTCGRRFLASQEGKDQKARHMDWHFSTNQRILSSAQRGQGQGRSWYVDEMEWVKSRDAGDGNESHAANGADAGAKNESGSRSNPQETLIRAPTDHRNTLIPCPICQDKFNMSWSEELQDFVYLDAVRVGDVVYHASCYADYKRDNRTPTPHRDKTPNSVLGKRGVYEEQDAESNMYKHQKR